MVGVGQVCVTLPPSGASKQVYLTLPPSNNSVCLHERDKCVWLHDREGWCGRRGHEREGWCGRGGLRQGTAEEGYGRRGNGEEGYGRRVVERRATRSPLRRIGRRMLARGRARARATYSTYTTHHTHTLSPPLTLTRQGCVQTSLCKAVCVKQLLCLLAPCGRLCSVTRRDAHGDTLCPCQHRRA